MGAERGDVITSGLFKLVAFLLLFALVVYEVGALVVNQFQLDTIGGDAARAALLVARQGGSVQAVSDAAAATLDDDPGATLEAVAVEGGAVSVTVTRPAPVLILDRVGALDDVVRQSVTKTRRLQ